MSSTAVWQQRETAVGVVGTGACTAVGMTAPATAAAVRAGIAGFAEHPFMVDRAGQPMIVARAPKAGDEVRGADRLRELALAAAQEALSVLGTWGVQSSPVPVVLGLPPARPGGLSGEDAQGLAEEILLSLRDTHSVAGIEIIATGHSAGLMAVERGWRILRSGGADFCLVGGVDSYMEPETLEWLEECEQIHGAGTENNAWGFIPGEAAGFCLLASAAAMARYQLAAWCVVVRAATAHEKNMIKTETVCIGQGLTQAVRDVLSGLAAGARIDHTVCDMNGEPYRADEFGFTVARVSERFLDAAEFLAPADCWGDVGAASGPLYLGLAVAAGGKAYSKGPHWLVWTSSESGERSSCLLTVETVPNGNR